MRIMDVGLSSEKNRDLAGVTFQKYSGDKRCVEGNLPRQQNVDGFESTLKDIVAVKGTSYTESAKGIDSVAKATEDAGLSKTEAYLDYLKARFGGNFAIMNVEGDQKSMDNLGAGTFGTNNVVIAPNILEKMANDPEKAQHYEQMISDYYKSIPAMNAQMYALGHEVHSSGLVIHPDGTAHTYVSGDLRPEVRRKIEAQMKAEDEAKRKRHQNFLDAAEAAAERRRQMIESDLKKRLMSDGLTDQIYYTTPDVTMDQSVQTPTVAAAMSAYKMEISHGNIM